MATCLCARKPPIALEAAGLQVDDLDLIEACALVAVLVAETTRTLTDVGYIFLNPRIRFS